MIGCGQVIRLADAQAAIPGPLGPHFADLLKHGTLLVKLSFPLNPNVQTPHEQDEVYVIVRGHGVLFHDGRRDAFGAGDLLFVPARTAHRFENFSEDPAVWGVVYGPPGGEAPLG